MSKPNQIEALRMLVDAVTESVAVAGDLGAPGGVLYAAMMQFGVTLEQFETLMTLLVQHGKLRRSGDLYFVAGPER